MHGDRQVYGKSEGGKAFCIAGFMKKLFIFDLDGTLVNSIYDLGDAMNAVLERYGFPVFDYDTYKHLVGKAELADAGTWLDGQRFSHSSSEADIASWVNGLNL